MAKVSARQRQAGPAPTNGHFKDEILDRLAEQANVAQFVSFTPEAAPMVRYVRMRDMACQPSGVSDAALALMSRSIEGSLNVRAFDPHQPKSNEFLYGLTDPSEVTDQVRRLGASGLYTIVNETIDVGDGGVSGVSFGDVMEFAPEDTPRCVEKPGTASLTRGMALKLLETVYGFRPELDQPTDIRVEFSIHPMRRGVRNTHTILWETEEMGVPHGLEGELVWPNRFSRFVGDKAFGLLVAEALGLRVPRTTVIGRNVPPFAFGAPTGTAETWIRTCPTEPIPGLFTTKHGWLDPYALLQEEDPGGDAIASVLAQDGVDARFSGAAATDAGGVALIEGVRGVGLNFMVGQAEPQALPHEVRRKVKTTLASVAEALGPARIEWVYDGEFVWVIQLHRGQTASYGAIIYPGSPTAEHRFPVERGLEELRSLVSRLRGTGDGVVLVGRVGVTSHFGDVLRKAEVPSRIEWDDPLRAADSPL